MSCPVPLMEQSAADADVFQPFYVYQPLSNVILDFETTDEHGNPVTPERTIKQAILSPPDRTPDVVAIHGPGGVGKSTILKALTQDKRLQQRFSHGIHHISLGIHATPSTVFHQLCHVLSNAGATKIVQTLQAENLVDNAIRQTLSWFRAKTCLFCIDDVWSSGMITGLISRLCNLGINGDTTTVILTTREANIASFAQPINRIRVNPRQPLGIQSQQILFSHAGLPLPQQSSLHHLPQSPITHVLKVCAGLPVCLAAAGKGANMAIAVANTQQQQQQQDHDPWTQYSLNLSHHREQLLQEPLTDYGNIYATFAASLALLENQRDQKLSFHVPLKFPEIYSRLCVLQKQEKAPASMLKHLWQLQTDHEATFVAELLVQVGMGDSGFHRFGPNHDQVWFFSIHDALHDFALHQAKIHDAIPGAHTVLLNGYRQFDESSLPLHLQIHTDTPWWSEKLEPDGYIHRNVCRHLKDSGHREELVDLLETPWWIKRQLKVNDIWAVHDDFGTGITAVTKASGGYDTPSPEENVLRLIREALVLSFGFISKNCEELWFQLYGRLLGHQDQYPRINTYLNTIRNGVKERWLRCLNPFLEAPGSSTIRMIITGAHVRCMAVMQGTDCVACGCCDGRLIVVNVMRGVVERSWVAHSNMVCTVASGKQGTLVLSGGADMLLTVSDVNTANIVFTFTGHSSRVNSVATYPDADWAVSASEDGTVHVWHMETGQIRATLAMERPVKRVAVFPDGNRLVTGGSDCTLRVWNTATGTQIGDALPDYNNFMNYVGVTSDGTRIISGSRDEVLRIHKMEKAGQASTPDMLIELDIGVECVAVSEDCNYIVSGHANGRIRLWDAVSGNPIGNTLEGHTDRICDISFLGSSDVIVSVSCDGQIRVWDVFRMLQLAKPAQNERITKVIFTRNGDKVVTGSKDGSIRIWETKTGRKVGETMFGHEGSISDLAFSPEERRLISVTNEKDRTVRVWDVDSQMQVAELGWHTGWISSVALGPIGNYAIAGALDKNVYLWDLKAPDETSFFSVLKGHAEWVQRVYVSDDGHRIISVGDDSEIFTWAIRKRKLLKKRNNAYAWQASREQIMRLVFEERGFQAADSSCSQRILISGREVLSREKPSVVLGTMECEIKDEVFYPNKNIFCIELRDGQIALLKIEGLLHSINATDEEGESRDESE